MATEHYRDFTIHHQQDGSVWFHRTKWPASYGKHADTVDAAKSEIDEIEARAAARWASLQA